LAEFGYNGDMEFAQSSHSLYIARYHVVFVTKFRREVMNKGFAEYTRISMLAVGDEMEGVEIEEINVQVDHVHMVVVIPPKYSVSRIVGRMKSESARRVREKFEWLDKVYWGTRSLWSVGCCVSTVGLNEKHIREYVKYQQKLDSGQAKLELL